MSLNPGMMTSNSDEWTTPSALFRALDRRFGFELDPAATKENALCPMYFTKEDSGLLKSRTGCGSARRSRRRDAR